MRKIRKLVFEHRTLKDRYTRHETEQSALASLVMDMERYGATEADLISVKTKMLDDNACKVKAYYWSIL